MLTITRNPSFENSVTDLLTFQCDDLEYESVDLSDDCDGEEVRVEMIID